MSGHNQRGQAIKDSACNRRMGFMGDVPIIPSVPTSTFMYGAVPDEYKDDPDIYYAL